MKPKAVKIVLMAQNMARAIAFHRDTLGFEESFSSPHWSELRVGDAILGIHGGGEGARVRTGLSLEFEDVAAAFAAAIEGGAEAVMEPQQREGEPIILAMIADTEGNEIGLTQYVGDSCTQG